MSDRPLPSSFDDNDDFYNEKGLQKVARKLREEPLIPIGIILTVAAFTNAYTAMRRGDHQRVQRMFRARVAAQGFTVAAMVAGGLYYGADRNKRKELGKLKQQQDAEEKRQKWIRELEVRDEEDKAIAQMVERRKKRAEERAGRDRPQDAAGPVMQAVAQTRSTPKASGEPAGQGEAPRKDNEAGEKGTSTMLGSLGSWFGGARKGADGSGAETQNQKDGSELLKK